MNSPIASLIFRHRESGEKLVHPIKNDASTIVGRDPSCTIHLESSDVSGKHCTLRIEDNQVFINDWYSEHGTIVNGEPIKNETLLSKNDQIQIGSFDVQMVIEQGMQTPVVAPPTEESQNPQQSHETNLEELEHQPVNSRDELIASLQVTSVKSNSQCDSGCNSPCKPQDDSQVEQLKAENAELRAELEAILAESTPSGASNSLTGTAFEQDEIETLRREISSLQSELAIRDQELAELCAGDMANAQDTECDFGETPQLVERLENLLDELQSSDHRIQSMEELLRVSDEAQQAEVEERRQIENWVSEIESRIRRREEEWQSQTEQLNKQVAELKEQREQAHEQLGQALDSKGDEVARQTQQQLEQVQEQNNQLAEIAMQLKRENDSLQAKVSEFETESEDGESPVALQRRLRQHELELAQERAEMSRQKAELTRIRDELEKAAGDQQKDAGTSDLRVKALRDHLREIHDEEKEKREEQRTNGGLASRLSRLWQRLDSR